MRQPFVEGDADTGEDGSLPAPASSGPSASSSRAHGASAPGAQAALVSTEMMSPRFGRLLTWSLGASAANDFLQAAFAALCAKANELEDEAP